MMDSMENLKKNVHAIAARAPTHAHPCHEHVVGPMETGQQAPVSSNLQKKLREAGKI